jgi:beta-glucosidase
MRNANLEALVRDRLQALDLADKVRLLTGRDGWTLHEMPQIGLRSVVTSDGPGGVRGTLWDERDPSLNVPNATALAATWDDDLVEAAGRLIGAEARKKGVHVLLAPTVGLHRSPAGGRNFEAWSEDPYLTGRLATAFMNGVQSQGVGPPRSTSCSTTRRPSAVATTRRSTKTSSGSYICARSRTWYGRVSGW